MMGSGVRIPRAAPQSNLTLFIGLQFDLIYEVNCPTLSAQHDMDAPMKMPHVRLADLLVPSFHGGLPWVAGPYWWSDVSKEDNTSPPDRYLAGVGNGSPGAQRSCREIPGELIEYFEFYLNLNFDMTIRCDVLID